MLLLGVSGPRWGVSLYCVCVCVGPGLCVCGLWTLWGEGVSLDGVCVGVGVCSLWTVCVEGT